MASSQRREISVRQTERSAKMNADYFSEDHEKYKGRVASIDSYAVIYDAISEAVRDTKLLLDIGNGGVFDYQTKAIDRIIGLDLCGESLPAGVEIPPNVTMVCGSALDIPQGIPSCDAVVMVMLVHHLVGDTVGQCMLNMEKAFAEAYRILQPGGKLVVMESCVPPWCFTLERLVFRAASFVIERTMKHPPTLQYPERLLSQAIRNTGFVDLKSRRIPLGKHVLQYGVRVPSWITPVQPHLFIAWRPR